MLGFHAGGADSWEAGAFVTRARRADAAALAGVLRVVSGSELAARVLRRRGLALLPPASSSLASLVALAFFLADAFARVGCMHL